MNRKLLTAFCALLFLAGRPASVLACAACYGQSDSTMATGMNWGIFSLLGVAGLVLGCLGTFFVFLATRPDVTQDQEPDRNGKNQSHNEHDGTV